MSNSDMELMRRMMQSPSADSGAITAKDFDEHFDNGGDTEAFVDFAGAARPNQKTRRVNVDFPAWMVDALDKEAEHLGVSRQALVKVWIANCLSQDAHTAQRL